VKTGYTAGARFCLVAAAEREGLRLITIVLGNPDEPFSDSAELLNYGFAAFERRPFVTAGDDLGPVDIPGGRIEGIAGGDLRALVLRTAASEVTRSIAVDPRAAYPPALGERIGVLRVRMGGLELGEVPVLASRVPPPPPPEAGPWWRRTIGAVLEAAGGVLRATIG
jgi:D-alanyl-D-alanine carboxypeptidase (penicillin-binding protein 5/6)